MIDISATVHEAVEGLKESSEPRAWAGTRQDPPTDIVLTYPFSRPDVDGGAVDIWDGLEEKIVSDLEEQLAAEEALLEKALVAFSVSTAFLLVRDNESKDEYEYAFWLTVFKDFQ